MGPFPNWQIIAVKNEDTKHWWSVAHNLYAVRPDLTPDAISPLLDEAWGETEVFATSKDVKEVQSWATGIDGWNNKGSPLQFKKI